MKKVILMVLINMLLFATLSFAVNAESETRVLLNGVNGQYYETPDFVKRMNTVWVVYTDDDLNIALYPQASHYDITAFDFNATGEEQKNSDASFTAEKLKISDTEQLNYWLFTPKNHTENMPLIIYLHGGSGKGDDINILTENGFCKWVSEGQFDDTPAYIIFPQLSSKYNDWDSVPVKRNVKQLIDFTVRRFSIDTNKISLTGHSMGGTGTFAIGAAYHELFSCIAPMSGSMAITEENISALSNIPVWAFVGSEDKIVPPKASIEFINALKNNGGNGEITIFDGATHFDIPELAYLDKDLDVVGWLIGHSKEKENKIQDVKNGVVSVNLTQANTYTLIFVDYDKYGRLNNLKSVTVAFNVGENLIDIPNDIELGNNDKIMLWASLGSLLPICESYIIKNN